MSRVYNKWSDFEKTYLLGYMVGGLREGKRAEALLDEFSTTYMISRASASNQWQKLVVEHKDEVKSARDYWRLVVKPQMLQAEKDLKRQQRLQAKVTRETQKSRAVWRKKKAKLAKAVSRTLVPTGLKVKPSQSNLYVQVDSQGVVAKVTKKA